MISIQAHIENDKAGKFEAGVMWVEGNKAYSYMLDAVFNGSTYEHITVFCTREQLEKLHMQLGLFLATDETAISA